MNAPRDDVSLSPWERRRITVKIWLHHHLVSQSLAATLLWAAIVGFLGAYAAIFFKEATEWLHFFFTGMKENYIESFREMPLWRRFLIPTIGALGAGLTLYFGRRVKGSQETSTDYMEAVVVGSGNLSLRGSAVKCLSAWFSSASGASIGREGPLVLLSSLVSSLLARWFQVPLAKKRLIVACGAAAGIASAYNAPIGGAFFVAEIVLGSMVMEVFGPIVVASVVATMVTHAHHGSAALYYSPSFTMHYPWEMPLYVFLGVLSGIGAAYFLRMMKWGEGLFLKLKLPIWLRLVLGGAIVGVLAMIRPEVSGNGGDLVFHILHQSVTWKVVFVLLVFKLLATTVTFGSGAVGGVFTPTLFTGAAFGYLFGVAVRMIFPDSDIEPEAYGLVGMGAFLAASTGAPIMAIIMLFELTLNYQILMPLMLACIVGYYMARALSVNTLYSEALERKGAAAIAQQLSTLTVRSLVSGDYAIIAPNANFREIATTFLEKRVSYLHLQQANARYVGVIALKDIEPYLDQPELGEFLIAQDLVHEDLPQIREHVPVSDVLRHFAAQDYDQLPVIRANGEFLGVLKKAEVLLFLAGTPRQV